MATDLSSSASSDTSSSRVHALRVLHWSIPVDDLEESQRFYSEVLGMRFRDRLGSDMVCMACSDPPQNVLLCKRPEPRPTTAETAGPSHYAFVVSPEDFDRAVENLQKWFDRPVLPNTPDRPGHWREDWVEHRAVKFFQGRSIYFLDPSGNTIEICDLLPGQG